MTLLISGAVLGALLEHLDEQAVELEGGVADRRGDLELAVLAGAAADVEEAGALVVAVMDAPVQGRLKTLADAADEDGIADEVERFWLLDFVGHGSGFPRSAPAYPTSSMPEIAVKVDAATPRAQSKAVLRKADSGGMMPLGQGWARTEEVFAWLSSPSIRIAATRTSRSSSASSGTAATSPA